MNFSTTLLKTLQEAELRILLSNSSHSSITVLHDLLRVSEVIVETEGSVRKMQKRALFHYKKVKKGTPSLTSPMFIASLQFF